ncbi:MAG: replicative DNA helicase [Ruminococcaceae bacterium]|nr:replicative DNA helicase [Oscillospiraceae bacterium]
MADVFNFENLPCSVEAEQALLGCILKQPDCFKDIADKVKADEFFVELNRKIFEIMVSLDTLSKKIDPVIINDRLKESGDWGEQDGRKYLLDLAACVPSTANVEQYADIVREKYYLRVIITASNQTIQEASAAGDDAAAVIDAAEKRIYDIRSGRSIKNEPKRIGDILINELMPRVESLAKGEDTEKGVDSGYKKLDSTLTGFNKGNLIIIGARPAMGKTNIALNFARNVTMLKGKTAVFFSLEMSKEEIAERLLSMDSGIENGKLRSGELEKDDWTAIGESIGRYSMANLYIDDSSDLTVPSLKSRVRRIPHADIVFIDYLGLLSSSAKKENRVQEISSITRELKIMAKELALPVVACAQLNRGSAEGRARRPVLTDLRESGSIEQDADVVLFLHRDYYYTTPGAEPDEEAQDVDPTAAELIIAKNRHGGLDNIKLHFDGEHSKFTAIQYIKDSDFA